MPRTRVNKVCDFKDLSTPPVGVRRRGILNGTLVRMFGAAPNVTAESAPMTTPSVQRMPTTIVTDGRRFGPSCLGSSRRSQRPTD